LEQGGNVAKSPELQKAIALLSENLQYVLQSKNPDPGAIGADAEWMTRWDIGPIKGKVEAYKAMEKQRQLIPNTKWRVMQRNEADVYENGIAVGRRLGPDLEFRHKRRPLMAMPEHL
jgi:hypothetical protein